MSSYPAKLALEEADRLGPARIRRIMEMLGKADIDLKGDSGLDGEVVMEILVARLAQQARFSR